jgi:hypothetical protein
LGGRAEAGELKNSVLVSDASGAFDDHMGTDVALRSYLDIRTDHTVRADDRIRGNHGRRINDGSRVKTGSAHDYFGL